MRDEQDNKAWARRWKVLAKFLWAPPSCDVLEEVKRLRAERDSLRRMHDSSQVLWAEAHDKAWQNQLRAETAEAEVERLRLELEGRDLMQPPAKRRTIKIV